MNRFLSFFHNIRFRNKLVLSYSVVVLIPLMMWTIYFYKQTNDTLMGQAQVSFHDISVNTAARISGKFQKIETAFAAVASDPNIGLVINAEYVNGYQKYYDVANRLDMAFNTLSMLHQEIKNIVVYTDGSIQSARQSFRSRDLFFREHQQFSDINGVDTFWFAEGDRLFAARLIYDLNRLSRSAIIVLEMDYAQMMEGGASDSFDNYGMLILNQDRSILYQKDHLQQSFKKASMTVPEFTEALSSHSDLLTDSVSIYPSGWNLLMYMDTNAILLPPQTAIGSMVLMLTVSALLLLVVIPLFSHSIVKRIELLNVYLSRVVKGGFREEISSNDRDEIGDIINRVGLMVRETSKLIEEVYDSRLQQREAAIKALQSQINPHFLYNTLSAINWQAIKSGNDDISRIATDLSVFYRRTLNQGRSITTVQQELEMTRAYLDIQQTTHEHSFLVEYSAKGDILEYNMPTVILQPIVENAIEHGVDMKMSGEPGKIKIDAYSDQGDIVIEVCDNGPGITQEVLQEIFSDNRRGYGVKNVNERLRLFFNDQYGLTFQPQAGGGTRAVIRIPKYIDLDSLKELI